MQGKLSIHLLYDYFVQFNNSMFLWMYMIHRIKLIHFVIQIHESEKYFFKKPVECIKQLTL